MTNPKKKRTTQITIETHQLLIIRTRGLQSIHFACPVCQKQTVAFVPAQAALAFRVSAPHLLNLLDKNFIHLAGDKNYCGSSLANHFGREIRLVED
jgi:hypothetical protein